jgi:hypothetical protein
MTGRDKDKRKGKRKRPPFGQSLRCAYDQILFTQLESNEEPRSPHRFFKESYAVLNQHEHATEHTEKLSPFQLSQIVHRHVNGLCIVTAGSQLPETSILEGVEILTKEAATYSGAEKRKRQAKMLKGGNVDDTVSPTTVIAKLKCKSGEVIPIFACVWGTVIEVNHSLTPELLLDDPLLNGYVAIILPSGEFPPKQNSTFLISGNDRVESAPSHDDDVESAPTKIAKVDVANSSDS